MTVTTEPGSTPDAEELFTFPAHGQQQPEPSEPVTPDSEPEPARELPRVRALDGLRGIAVIAVVGYHFAPGLVPGGFLGVSLFFTLSGFLITNLLLLEWKGSAGIGVRRFWGRRFRRLLPAALLAMAVGVGAAAVAADPAALRALPGDIAAALAYVANWHFIIQGDTYGAGYAQPSVVLQFWSLAIEEQFYLGVALVAYVLARHAKTRKPWFITFGGLALASMVSTVVLYDPADTSRVYFGSDTRAFELLAGVLLAVAIGHRLPQRLARARWRQLGGVLVAGAFLAAVLHTRTSDIWLYRGGLWGVALVSCGLILVTLDNGLLSRALAWRPLVAIGLISYGIYLFHWPMLIWLTPERTGLDGAALAAVRIAATLVLAVPSYFLLEMPIRRRRLHHRPLKLRASVVVPTVAVIAAVLLLSSSVLSGEAGNRAVAAPAPDVALGSPAATAPPPQPVPTEKVVPPVRRVLFLGDSLIHQAFPTIKDRLAAAGIEAEAIGAPGQSLMTAQGLWLVELQASIDAFDPDLVVLESCCGMGTRGAPETYTDDEGRQVVADTEEQYAIWAKLAAEATDLAESGGRRAMWILAPPARTNGYYGPIEGRIGKVNDTYTALVTCHTPTGLIDWRVIAAPDGSFTTSLPDASGQAVPVRTPDGLHFTPAGQALLADFTRDSIESYWQAVGGRNDEAPVRPAVPACSG